MKSRISPSTAFFNFAALRSELRSGTLLHENQIKGWSRAKKEALIRGDFQDIHEIVKGERKRREKEKKMSHGS